MSEKNGRVTKIVGAVISGVVVLIIGASLVTARGNMQDHEVRLRCVEQSDAAVQERLDGIQRSLDRIERRIEGATK